MDTWDPWPSQMNKWLLKDEIPCFWLLHLQSDPSIWQIDCLASHAPLPHHIAPTSHLLMKLLSNLFPIKCRNQEWSHH